MAGRRPKQVSVPGETGKGKASEEWLEKPVIGFGICCGAGKARLGFLD
jgi:hypothetical protein